MADLDREVVYILSHNDSLVIKYARNVQRNFNEGPHHIMKFLVNQFS